MIRYLHRNPVKRGLVERPEDWPWSSYRHYATGWEGTVEIESQWTAFRRGNQSPEGVRMEGGERFCSFIQAAKGAAWMRRSPIRAWERFERVGWATRVEDAMKRMMEKLADYEAMGIGALWLVDAKTQVCSRYRAGQPPPGTVFALPGSAFTVEIAAIGALAD